MNTAPLIMPVDTARLLAGIPDVVPLELIAAARAVLQHSHLQLLDDVRASRGARGNGDKRRRAGADAELAWQLGKTIDRRQADTELLQETDENGQAYTWAGPEADRIRRAVNLAEQVEKIPPLGEQQWAVIAAYWPTWKGQVADLVLVAQATVPDDEPLDHDTWRRWARRERLHRRAGTARHLAGDQRRTAHAQAARSRERDEEAARARRSAEVARDRAEAAARAAMRWDQQACVYEAAAELPDEQLLAYEQGVKAGLTPAAALAAATATQTV